VKDAPGFTKLVDQAKSALAAEKKARRRQPRSRQEGRCIASEGSNERPGSCGFRAVLCLCSSRSAGCRVIPAIAQKQNRAERRNVY